MEGTKAHIAETVEMLILQQGIFFPTSQQIATEAGVERTLLHYYFDSVTLLRKSVGNTAVLLWSKKIHMLFSKEGHVCERIRNYIDSSLLIAAEFPYLERFISADEYCASLTGNMISRLDKEMERLSIEIAAAAEQGLVCKVRPVSVIFSLLSIADQPINLLKHLNSENEQIRLVASKILRDRTGELQRCYFTPMGLKLHCASNTK